MRREGILFLGGTWRLDAFSAYSFRTWLPGLCPWRDNRDTSGPSLRVLSYYGVLPSRFLTPTRDRDRTVSRRSEPSSRTALTGEQPDPWELLHPQDAMSRHRGAKPDRRCELSDPISLLSPEYLLFVERWRFHIQTTGSFGPTFVPARAVALTVNPPSAHTLDARLPTALRGAWRSSVTF